MAWGIIPILANSSNPIAAVEFASSLKGRERETLTREAVQVWAASDGPAALEWISRWPNITERSAMQHSALTQWASFDGRAALDFWVSTKTSDSAKIDPTEVGVLQAWAGKEPEAALAWIRAAEGP